MAMVGVLADHQRNAVVGVLANRSCYAAVGVPANLLYPIRSRRGGIGL